MHHSENDSLDHHAALNVAWPKQPLMFGLGFNYDLLNTTVIEAGQRTMQETYGTVFTGGYELSPKSTFEINLRQTSVSYAVASLIPYRDFLDEN